ncbi:MAG: hypothetical protein COX77_02065 [Candidatus Komeilibacteria bacterium CG_4_10_14_0_2_um_filter_37_10]|uniref:Uncharacterized protein n=1 Tax=Candidatus Komeilibacteria bacterium CG_4_10_14_0_2_um_filter_37_10 TaxID=1974470 RepID=A0A2M7VFC7_9BACT|nr:MAG: hypothetical protein COX77_02065 [Candidatus Komeilibacteria bacterium CG_4_10_14_0_2_um_filter_37_10]PJA92517.1 MAG: hypothetical protein CO133_02775 [Candidatus Komeilibacteria bacterium CG_4_9_14_3_um_filter_37_5]
MYNKIPALVKTLIFLVFLYNLGVGNLFNYVIEDSTNTPPVQEQQRRTMVIERFIQERISIAKQKIKDGHQYRPKDYFSDLRLIDEQSVALSWRPAFGKIMELQTIINDGLQQNKFTTKEVDREAKLYKDPLVNHESIIWLQIIQQIGLGHWLINKILRFYFLNLPLALILLFLWQYQDQKRIILHNPISFCLAVIIYPLTIGVIWYIRFKNFGRNVYGEAILRAAKDKAFSSLAPDEIAVIKQFVTSKLQRKKYQEQITLRYGVARRSLLFALMVTLLVMLIPQSLTAKQIKTTSSVIMVELVNKASPIQSSENIASHDLDSQSQFVFIYQTIWVITHAIVKRIIYGYRQRIDHIPIKIVERLNSSEFIYQLIKLIGKKSEKFYCYIISCRFDINRICSVQAS